MIASLLASPIVASACGVALSATSRPWVAPFWRTVAAIVQPDAYCWRTCHWGVCWWTCVL